MGQFWIKFWYSFEFSEQRLNFTSVTAVKWHIVASLHHREFSYVRMHVRHALCSWQSKHIKLWYRLFIHSFQGYFTDITAIVLQPFDCPRWPMEIKYVNYMHPPRTIYNQNKLLKRQKTLCLFMGLYRTMGRVYTINMLTVYLCLPGPLYFHRITSILAR